RGPAAPAGGARPVHALEGETAADEQAPLGGERRIEGRTERADGGNGHHAERDTQHEDCEAAGAGAKLAKRDGESERQAQTTCRRGCYEARGSHDAALRRLVAALATRPLVARPSA